MLTFEEIKEIAKKVAMERAKTDNVNVWYIRKLGDWYYFYTNSQVYQNGQEYQAVFGLTLKGKLK